MLAQAVIKCANYHVLAAANGFDGIQTVEIHLPDIISLKIGFSGCLVEMFVLH
jgi:hypothetical protein